MKSKFSSADIQAAIAELNELYTGMRVNNIYDVDGKTYLFKLQKPDAKCVILIESGCRIHATEFDWPKNDSPSGFSMKLRKHLKGRRLESVEQLGIDRILDLKFGSNEAAYHVILEIYDRGNIVLTDHNYVILNILRPRTDQCQDIKFIVREKYPLESAKHSEEVPSFDQLCEILKGASDKDSLKKMLNIHLPFGPALVEHCMIKEGLLPNSIIGKDFSVIDDGLRLKRIVDMGYELLDSFSKRKDANGYIIQNTEKNSKGESILTYHEFHPYLFEQYKDRPSLEFNLFNSAVDEFFSKLEAQRLDLKVVQQEKSAMKKLENVKKDHEKRIDDLKKDQDIDRLKAELIETNLELVDQAILIVQKAIAEKLSWNDINSLLKEARQMNQPVAMSIKSLKLQKNHICMGLLDPFADNDQKSTAVDIDLALSAYANARKYFDMKKQAKNKEHKTIESSGKALKSAERKTKEALKEVAVAVSIKKARKVYWFEKFHWFISSENFLVISGRDQQQNEIIVKKYLRSFDVYVHADLHGAASVVIRNLSQLPIPPKTLNEAGTMAVCHSAAWDARVVTSAWWVHASQVSKTAPTGEYLTTGSFMIRGKKNFLPPCYLVYGFGFLFKLDEESMAAHAGERRVRTFDDVDNDKVNRHNDAIEPITSDAQDSMDENLNDDNSNGEETVTDDNETESQVEKSPEDDHKDSALKSDASETESEGEEKCLEETSSMENCTEISTETKLNAEGAALHSEDVGEELSDDDVEFPDTIINIGHVTGKQPVKKELEDEEAVFYLGDDKPVTMKQKTEKQGGPKLSAKQRKLLKKGESLTEALSHGASRVEKCVSFQDEAKVPKVAVQEKPKRGQKKASRLKKYKDQDEEERQLRMELLASAGPVKEKKLKGKKAKEAAKLEGKRRRAAEQAERDKKKLEYLEKQKFMKTNDDDTAKINDIDEADLSDDENKTGGDNEDLAILNGLTGSPNATDALIFCVPVAAPYTALQSYKFKVKLTPGSTKRGKAAKHSLQVFMHDRLTLSREKDLLKVCKDNDLSRNMPGKVKVSAPNYSKLKK